MVVNGGSGTMNQAMFLKHFLHKLIMFYEEFESLCQLLHIIIIQDSNVQLYSCMELVHAVHIACTFLVQDAAAQ